MSDNPKRQDPRLIYIACAWLIAHRGHFLSSVSIENISSIFDFTCVYNDFKDYFNENNFQLPWECDITNLSEVLKQSLSVSKKEKAIKDIIAKGYIYDNDNTEEFPFNKSQIIKLMSNGKSQLDKIFNNEDYKELGNIQLSMDEERISEILEKLQEYEAELILRLKSIYDWTILYDILKGNQDISYSKVLMYEQHKKDLKNLKYIIRKYAPEEYDNVFRSDIQKDNYVAYSYNLKNIKNKSNVKGKTNIEKFSKYVKKILENIKCDDNDLEMYNDITNRLDLYAFMPKQVNTNNRVIPYQVYYVELKKLLDKAKEYLPFLNDIDKDGVSTIDKILSLMKFKIPYYVGPINNKKSENNWSIRKEGEEFTKVYPWNFNNVIDLDRSEEEFIKRMTNSCRYLPMESVLPKQSLLYAKCTILSEINKIKIDNQAISIECKQRIFNELFKCKSKVNLKNIKDFLLSNQYMSKESTISGISDDFSASYSIYVQCKDLLTSKTLTEEQLEEIIKRSTYSQDKIRFKIWLINNYKNLSEKTIKKLIKLNCKDFGTLSKELLNQLEGFNTETGEVGTVLYFLWNYNFNLSEIISGNNFTFRKIIDEINAVYYQSNPMSLNERLNNMYISNSVKRSIIRTIDMLDDVVKVKGYAPNKLFIEMARGGLENQKGKKTKSRKEQLEQLYEQINTEEVRAMQKELEELGENANNILQSEAVFLYFTQLGRCMYTFKPIDFANIKNEKIYDIDHIYPRCYKKDDSLNNKVLVLSNVNGDKNSNFPIDENIRKKMTPFWQMLLKNKLITEEKFNRLTRNTNFTEEERWDFITRQLVETRQSTKALAQIIKDKYPETEVVYVKAGLVSEFRQQFDLIKCRSVNDLHHAKDAYLNIIVGNVYNSKFTEEWFKNRTDNNYSIKTETIFKNKVILRNKIIYDGAETLKRIKRTMDNNHVHLTKYAYKRTNGQNGGLFDQNPLKAADELIPLKQGMDTSKYGGYQKSTTTYFSLVKFKCNKKTDIIIMPVELMFAKEFETNDEFAINYAKKTIKRILELKEEISHIEFLLNKRPIKLDTILQIDKFKVCISGRADRRILVRYMTSCYFDLNTETYIKKLDSFARKKEKNNKIKLDSKYDFITKEKNIDLYNKYLDKYESDIFNNLPASKKDIYIEQADKFKNLPIEEQIIILQDLIKSLKTNTPSSIRLPATLSSWRKKYQSVRIIDSSASGLFEKKSINLLELL